MAAAIVALVGAAAIASKHHDNDRDDGRYDDRRYNDDYRRYDGATFRCESNDKHYVSCRMPTRGHPEIRRRISKPSCRFSQSWGVDRKSVWVDDGCRAEFPSIEALPGRAPARASTRAH